MHFKEHSLFAYEDELFQGTSLSDILAQKSAFKMSGLADLRESLLMTEEFFYQFPKLLVKELILGDMDPVWLEQKDTRKAFSRLLKVPLKITQEKPTIKREAHGEVQLKPTTFHMSIVIAFRLDYIPRTGDQVQYRDTMYELTRVYVDPRDYFQQSGFPLYLRCESRVANFDIRGLKTCEGEEHLREGGMPVRGNPEGPVIDNKTPAAQTVEDGGAKIFTIPI